MTVSLKNKLSERRVPAKVSESKASEFVGVSNKRKVCPKRRPLPAQCRRRVSFHRLGPNRYRHPTTTTMAKGKSKRKQKDGPPGAEGGAGPSADYQGPGESWGGEHMNQAAAPILAMHPSGAHVAVAYGKGVAVFDTATGARIPLRAASDVPSIGEGVAHTPASPAMRAPLDPSGDWHAEAIRAIAFDPSGRFLATAGDDKAVRLFAKTDEPAYECVRRWHDRKKVTRFFSFPHAGN